MQRTWRPATRCQFRLQHLEDCLLRRRRPPWISEAISSQSQSAPSEDGDTHSQHISTNQPIEQGSESPSRSQPDESSSSCSAGSNGASHTDSTPQKPPDEKVKPGCSQHVLSPGPMIHAVLMCAQGTLDAFLNLPCAVQEPGLPAVPWGIGKVVQVRGWA